MERVFFLRSSMEPVVNFCYLLKVSFRKRRPCNQFFVEYVSTTPARDAEYVRPGRDWSQSPCVPLTFCFKKIKVIHFVKKKTRRGSLKGMDMLG